MSIKAKSIKEYEDFIQFIEKFIQDREQMLNEVNNRISDYTGRSNNAMGDYKEYCNDRIKEENNLLEDIIVQLKGAKKVREELVESYEKEAIK